MNGIKELGLTQIDRSELQEGDCLFAQIQSTVINHCAIYLNGGLVLHHLYHKLSCREPMNRYQDAWKIFIRCPGE